MSDLDLTMYFGPTIIEAPTQHELQEVWETMRDEMMQEEWGLEEEPIGGEQ